MGRYSPTDRNSADPVVRIAETRRNDANALRAALSAAEVQSLEAFEVRNRITNAVNTKRQQVVQNIQKGRSVGSVS